MCTQKGGIIMNQPILTQDEGKEHVTLTLLAFRQDVSREMEACGEPLEITSDLYAVLYELTERFELNPGQQALVCGLPVCRLYDPPGSSGVTGVVAAETAVGDLIGAKPQRAHAGLPVAGD
jgi:hypothetical protein